MFRIFFGILCLLILGGATLEKRFFEDLRRAALKTGVSAETFEAVFGNFRPDMRALKRAQNQPELSLPLRVYVDAILSKGRARGGRQMIKRHKKLLERLEKRYGVDKEILVAVWGIESNYGVFQGNHNVLRALATVGLGMPRRREFAQTELLAALRILETKEASISHLKGSWAGAMGQTQFIPSTFERYAVDADGDGRRDIWGSVADALGSAAHYLRKMGWEPGRPWGASVRLPQKFDYTLADGVLRARAFWRHKGVLTLDGRPLPEGAPMAVVVPAGHRGPAFLVGRNFLTLRHYNNSQAYSFAVVLLAERLKIGSSKNLVLFPRERQPLNPQERLHVQRLLNAEGFEVGVLDGHFGTKTKKALRAWQKTRNMPADGYPTRIVLRRLIREQPPVRDIEALEPRLAPSLRWARIVPRARPVVVHIALVPRLAPPLRWARIVPRPRPIQSALKSNLSH